MTACESLAADSPYRFLRAAAVIFFVAIAGCSTTSRKPSPSTVTVGFIQTECEREYSSLAAIVNCLRVRTKAEPVLSAGPNADILDLYITVGRAHASAVADGSATEMEARERWRGSAAILNEANKLRASFNALSDPKKMSLLDKIGYVLQSTAAGMRAGEDNGQSSIRGPGEATGCRKAQVCDDYGMNCTVRDLCDKITDLPSVGLAPLPPLPSTRVKPLPSIDIPPLGTSSCEYKQVNGDWVNVCQ